MTGWTRPAERWEEAIDPDGQPARLGALGVLLGRWPALPSEPAPTDCLRVGSDYWLWQPGVGGLHVLTESPGFIAYRHPAVDAAVFESLVRRSWLPAVYQVWSRQVLHASAVCWTSAGRVLALVGPTGVGKSTLACGLGARVGWQQIGDDTLAFSSETDGVHLHPLLNYRRLRPATAAHFGDPAQTEQPIDWPSGPLRLSAIYLPEEAGADSPAVAFTPVSAADSYRALLGQAFALSIAVPSHNERLMLDYLALARVPAFRMAYRRTFAALDEVLEGLSSHARLPGGSG